MRCLWVSDDLEFRGGGGRKRPPPAWNKVQNNLPGIGIQFFSFRSKPFKIETLMQQWRCGSYHKRGCNAKAVTRYMPIDKGTKSTLIYKILWIHF